MSSLLTKIDNFIVNLVNSIAPIIKLDISVVDDEINRISGTGQFEKYVGLKLPKNCANYHVIKNGEAIIINNPQKDDICKNCPVKKICLGDCSIIYPIALNNKIIGSISFSAFSESQIDYMKNNKENLMEFIKQLTKTISNEAKRYINELLMNDISQAIVEGILVTNYTGEIIYSNRIAKKIYNIETNNKKNINSLFPNFNMNKTEAEDNINDDTNTITLYKGKRIIITAKNLYQHNKSDILFLIKNSEDLGLDFISDIPNENKLKGLRTLVGISKSINDAKNIAYTASRCDLNVIIKGESGTGKELFARGIHDMSMRKNKPFIAINCAAIPENLFESELFGYDEGAFTGAKKKGKPGKFELANDGVLFLDEIGDLDLSLQPKLLRAIEYGEIQRVGGTNPIKSNVRIIAVTNRNLEEMVENKKFREDLYYRLNIISINLPSLKERREDILVIAKYFLDRSCRKYSKNIIGFTEKTEKIFLLYDWPGNVREVLNTIEYAVNVEKSQIIQESSLPNKLKKIRINSNEILLGSKIKDIEEKSIRNLLEQYGNTVEGKNKIAEILGISLSTLYRRLKDL